MFTELPTCLQVIRSEQAFGDIPSVAMTTWDYLSTAPSIQENMSRLVLVRHGESESNRNGSIAGRTDSPLTALGIKQAHDFGHRLQELRVDFDAVYSSPMQRARHTAQYICPGQPITTDARLHERFYGPIEGKGAQEYQPYILKETAALRAFNSFVDKFAYKPHHEFESMQEVYERVLPFITSVHQKHLGQTVLIAAHGGLLKSLFLFDIAKKGFETDYRSIFLANTGSLVIEVQQEGMNIHATTGISYKGSP